MQKPGCNSLLLFPIERKLSYLLIIFFHPAVANCALGLFVVCADSLVYCHVNRTVLEPLVL